MKIKLNWQGRALYPVNMGFDKKVDGGAFRLFGILFSLREQERDVTLEELAKRLRCNCGTIQKYLMNLVESGWATSHEGEVILNMRKRQKHANRCRKDSPGETSQG